VPALRWPHSSSRRGTYTSPRPRHDTHCTHPHHTTVRLNHRSILHNSYQQISRFHRLRYRPPGIPPGTTPPPPCTTHHANPRHCHTTNSDDLHVPNRAGRSHPHIPPLIQQVHSCQCHPAHPPLHEHTAWHTAWHTGVRTPALHYRDRSLLFAAVPKHCVAISCRNTHLLSPTFATLRGHISILPPHYPPAVMIAWRFS